MGILSWRKRRTDPPSMVEIDRAFKRLLPPVPIPSDAELAEVWVRDGYNTLVSARHILFALPAGAPLGAREQVRQQAEAICARAAAGEDFESLAREYSADPRGRHGGDLGFFGRHRMVEEFERAAFALAPGQVSAVVETPFGYHVIRVDERRVVTMPDKAAFRKLLLERAQTAVIRRYVEQLRRTVRFKVERGAERQVRELAIRRFKPSGWVAKRALVRYSGGKLTVADMFRVLQEPGNAQQLAQIASARDVVLRGFMREQALRRLIWETANSSAERAGADAWQWIGLRSGRIGSAPGAGLLWFADFFYSRKDSEEVLKPVVEDMRLEYFEARLQGRPAKAHWIRVRGTTVFSCAACRLTPLGKAVAWLLELFG